MQQLAVGIYDLAAARQLGESRVLLTLSKIEFHSQSHLLQMCNWDLHCLILPLLIQTFNYRAELNSRFLYLPVCTIKKRKAPRVNYIEA